LNRFDKLMDLTVLLLTCRTKNHL